MNCTYNNNNNSFYIVLFRAWALPGRLFSTRYQKENETRQKGTEREGNAMIRNLFLYYFGGQEYRSDFLRSLYNKRY